MNKKYFSMEKVGQTATINIYGDITSWAWEEFGEMSAVNLSKQLEALGDVDQIDIFINSYGGEVAEGLAIYNALRRHKAKIRTVCDGFACSIASVIFMAGDERIMNEASLLMVHNAWTWATGNAEELRKQAEDLEKITQASVEAYKAHSNLSEKEIKALMDAETWILPQEALEYGFATSINKTEKTAASQNSFKKLFELIKTTQKGTQKAKAEEEPEEPGDESPEDESKSPEDDTDETKDGEDASKDDDEEKKNSEEAAAQNLWSGFFNAILK